MDMVLMRVLLALRRSRGRDRWSRAQLERYQAARLGELRRHAYARSPFYRRFHAGLQDRPLSELPVLTKSLLMENFDDVATDPAIRLADLRTHVDVGSGRRYLDRYRVCATSGSTGRPALFLFDRSDWAVFLAGLSRARDWSGLGGSLSGRVRMAGVGSSAQANPWHASSQAAATLRSRTLSWWMPTLSLATTTPLPEMVRQLNAWRPSGLAGYSSILRVLADEQLAGRLHINPHQVIAGSEILTEETRRRAELAWGPVVFEVYGTTETGGGLAAECGQHEGMHLFEDLAIVEVVDEHNRPVPPGHDGDRVLVTVLDARTLPLIRYEVEDSIRIAATPAACGRPYARIEKILGRTWDALRLPALSGGEVTVQPLTFTAILDTLPVTGWQVVQQPTGSLTVLWTGADDALAGNAVAAQIERALLAQGVQPPAISVEQATCIPRTAAGKAPLIRAARSQ